MRLVLSSGEVVFCLCAAALVLYVSPLFLDNGSGAWEFLLIWDDQENFLDNAVIQSGLSPETLYTMFTMTRINVYEPFGWLLKTVEVQTVGLDSWCIRIVTVALHFGAAAVLARVSATLLDVLALLSDTKSGAKWGDVTRGQSERRHWFGCCISAMVFAIHPVHVEVVGWPSAQPYTLCALFSNLALYIYVRAMHRKLCEASTVRRSVEEVLRVSIFGGCGHSDLLCCAFYLSALLSKSACILLPVGFFLVDVLVYVNLQPHLPIPSARQCWLYIAGKLPVVATLLTFLSVMLMSNYQGMHRDADVLSLALYERVIKSLSTPIWVLRQILWPTKLRPHYQLRPGELSVANPEYLLSLVSLVSLMLFTLWLFQHRQAPQHFLALIYFAVIVLPVSGLIQHGMVSAGCDRYAYLCSTVAVPYGGVALARWIFGNGAKVVDEKGSERVKRRRQTQRQKSAFMGVGLVLVGTLLSISTNMMGNWKNEDNLLQYSLRMDPTDWRVLDQRATYLLTTGQCSRKNDECRQIWELAYYFTPMGTLKSTLQRLKLLVWLDEMDRACDDYMKLLKLHPDSCHVHNNAGVCLIRSGDLDEARREFERALQTPGYEYVYDTPMQNLNRLDEWLILREDARARGQEDTVPQVLSKIMF
ncbi:hypothetical protein PR003_g7863 [Phytophthora rubi]|uniref:Uncharacterized protein n=3 Tax=Phytophthora TaxID=4783 RepID=A0A6A3N8E0_9STRA|nr:hypothetical protein PR001_g7321 [Phytophthora rubi]KAE9345614.1 hypothetical protein PR003_g7863 [Phytophthora rubi]